MSENNIKIPFVDLVTQYRNMKTEIDGAIASVIESSSFIGGTYVKKFEKEFADFIGIKNCVGCASGTDALEVLLRVMGIGRGDEVLVPANTWISTAEAVTTVGARVVFVDSHPALYTIDVSKIEEKITERTKAIMPVHLYGLPAEMDDITAIAKKYNLKIIEDCAQSHGAEYKGRRTGTIGDAAAFSFFPGKNLGAYGDAGGMVTNNDELALKSRMISNHGRVDKYDHQMEGRNSRLDGLQAAILSAKLSHLSAWTEARRKNAAIYTKFLEGSGLQIPKSPDYSKHVYHLYVVQVENRSKVQDIMAADGIATGVHYPYALPTSKAYSYLGLNKEDYPVATKQMDRILSLPMYAELDEEKIKYICDSLLKAVNS